MAKRVLSAQSIQFVRFVGHCVSVLSVGWEHAQQHTLFLELENEVSAHTVFFALVIQHSVPRTNLLYFFIEEKIQFPADMGPLLLRNMR